MVTFFIMADRFTFKEFYFGKELKAKNCVLSLYIYMYIYIYFFERLKDGEKEEKTDEHVKDREEKNKEGWNFEG